MKIKDASLENLNDTSSLFNKYLTFYNKEPQIEKSKKYLEERIINKDSKILIAYIDGKPAGLCQLYFSFSSLSLAKTVILNDLYVDKDFRNKGVAKKLIEEVERFSSGNDYISIQLETAKTNTSAINLYESLGYKTSNNFLYYSKKL